LKKSSLSVQPEKILRLRVFAGPNGSGKTTVIRSIRKQKVNGRKVDLGYFVNADDIAEDLTNRGVSFKKYSIKTTPAEFREYALKSGLINEGFNESLFLKSFKLRANHLILSTRTHKENLAQLVADFLRRKLLNERKKFSFETVFSHPSKVDFMREARNAGYKVYLYFVSTESPDINVFRVKARKMKGGHDVPEDKVRSRYDRSMDFMFEASLVADKSYFFDNSSAKKDPKVIAQVEKSGLLPSVQIYGERPNWFIKYFSIKLLEYYAALDS
jgi:predicted ABC-type ATPase